MIQSASLVSLTSAHQRPFCKRMVSGAIAGWLLFGGLCQARASDRIKQEYESTKSLLASHCDGFSIDDDSRTSELLDREWSLTGAWVARYLDTHPASNPEQLGAAIHELYSGLECHAVELDRDTYVVATREGELGTFFVISQAGGMFKVAWHVKDAAMAHPQHAHAVERWSARGARGGGLFGTVGVLPRNEKGNPRFYIDATHAQAMGATVGAQLSIWEWNGESASPILIRDYAYMIDTPGSGASFERDLLRIRTKGEFKTFFSCGGCSEPQVEWRLRITAAKVIDLGRYPLVPELSAVDEVYYRIQRRMAMNDVATPAVETVLKSIIRDIRTDPAVRDDYAPLGMLMDWKVLHSARDAKLCLSLDGTGRLLFKLVPIRGRLFVVDANEVDNVRFGQSCADVLARRP